MREPIVRKEVTVSEKGGPMSRRAFTKLGAAAAGGLGVTAALGDQQASVADALKSEFLMLLRFEYPDRISGNPKAAGLPGMSRYIVPISRGTFDGPKLKGTVIPPSGEWAYRYGDRPGGPDVRLTLRTDDDQLIFMYYKGIILDSVPNGQPGYWRTQPWFEAGTGKYAFLNNRIAVGVGRYPKPGQAIAEYRIYQIL
jgi:uncharacterized protein DUF3237